MLKHQNRGAWFLLCQFFSCDGTCRRVNMNYLCAFNGSKEAEKCGEGLIAGEVTMRFSFINDSLRIYLNH